MGRLFWKFFFFFWLAQLMTVLGVGVSMWLHGHPNGGREPSMMEAQSFPADRLPVPHPDRPLASHHPDMRLLPLTPLLGGGVVSLLFAALLSWYFSRPIRVLREAFVAAAHGNLDQRIARTMSYRRDELADLGHGFDSMTAQLNALLQGQRRLLHDISHELRSPLARLQAIIGLIRQKPEELHYLMERLERESVRIDLLVGELLTLARLESGMLFRKEEAVDLNLLLDDVAEDARLEADAKQVQVSSCQPDSPPWVRGSQEMLHRALANVVRNAIKYTPADSTIAMTLTVDKKDGYAQIQVVDGGFGVAAHEIDNIFKPFFRSQMAAMMDGHGLGLAITREIVESHGGTVSATNLSGGGLCISVRLPLLAF